MSILPASSIGDESTGFYTETINQSLRFNKGDGAELSRTPSSASNRKTWTLSTWVKISGATDAGGSILFCAFASSYSDFIYFDTSDRLTISFGNAHTIGTNAVFRDTTNWFHVVVAVDVTESTATDRVKIYINGTQQTLQVIYSSFPSNTNYAWNNTVVHTVGGSTNFSGYQFDGYLAEFNFIDGSALTPSSFGETKNGVWIPKAISGLTYGTNGFRLTFADSSDLGNNANSTDGTNDFTTVTNLASTDVVPDSPTNNFCTYNPLDPTNMTLAEGNLETDKASNASNDGVNGTFLLTSGKWYFEFKPKYFSGGSGAFANVGVRNPSGSAKDALGSGNAPNATVLYLFDGNVQDFNSDTSYATGGAGNSYGATGSEMIYGVALDMDNGKIWFSINGTYPNSGNPATGANEARDDINTNHPDGVFPAVSSYNVAMIANFGQNPSFNGDSSNSGHSVGTETDSNGIGLFRYAPPSGYLAICSKNLSDTTISPNSSNGTADEFFNTVLYTGDGNSTQDVTGVGFQPDWTWIKERSSTSGHVVQDSSRGYDKFLVPNGTTAESTGVINSVSSDGFQTTNSGVTNQSSQTYVAWNWKAGGAPSADNSAGAGNTPTSNSVKIDGSNLGSALAGTIPATRLSANTTAGFSIVTYTGTGTQSDTVAHGLGKKPAWYFTKSRSEAQNWHVYHEELDASAPENYVIFLNASNAKSSSSADFWNSTAPTTSVVSVGDDNSSNKNGTTYVMYCFAEVLGFSKFGTYNGNSSTDGTYVFTGFRPAMVIFKATHSDSWVIADNKRDPHNQVNGQLFPDLSNAESTSNAICDFLSNGFKLRRNAGSINQNTYIYMAFAEQTFKFSNAR